MIFSLQVKLDLENLKESLLTGGKSEGAQTLKQQSENMLKLRSNVLKGSTAETSISKGPGTGVVLVPAFFGYL